MQQLVCLTERAFEEMIATLGYVHVETWVRVLQHHLVPPLLWRGGPVCLHFLRLLRLQNITNRIPQKRDGVAARTDDTTAVQS